MVDTHGFERAGPDDHHSFRESIKATIVFFMKADKLKDLEATNVKELGF